jgi:hypothetical protein
MDATTLLTVLESRPGSTGGGSAGIASAGQPSLERDPLLRVAAELRSADASRVHIALRAGIDPSLVGFVVPLLGDDTVAADALHALRRIAPLASGALIDALLDPSRDVVVRRRLPRALRAAPTQRALDGMLEGLADPSFGVRYQCGVALVHLLRKNHALRVPRDRVLAAALAEEAIGTERGLEHVFHLLSLVLEREPLEVALLALRGADAGLRGTALEYLDQVLPGPLKSRLAPHLGERRPADHRRPAEELRDALLRSSVGTTRSSRH